jgi:hypothetical protein
MMIELTEPLQQALDRQQGEPLQLFDPRTKQTYVLVRSEVYEWIKTLLEDDLDRIDVARLIADAMREDDENDPYLASYQEENKPL